MSNGAPEVPFQSISPNPQQQRIYSLLKQCQQHAIEASCRREGHFSSSELSNLSPTASPINLTCNSSQLFIETLQSLHQSLVDFTLFNVDKSSLEQSPAFSTDIHESALSYDRTTATESITHFLQSVANNIIHEMYRIIPSIDEEIEGSFTSARYKAYGHGWYSEILNGELLKDVDIVNIDKNDETIGKIATFNDQQFNDAERWIDKCLDMCGYRISLEVAIGCLRRVVHASRTVSSTNSTRYIREGSNLNKELQRPNFSAVVTSLRTIRRRLLVIPSCSCKEESSFTLPTPLCNILTLLQKIPEFHDKKYLLECVSLPLEYHLQKQSYVSIVQGNQTIIDEESVSSNSAEVLATNLLPTLIASACYSVELPVPVWASVKVFYSLVLNCACGLGMAGELLSQSIMAVEESNVPNLKELPHQIRTATSIYFQNLMMHAILSRNSEALADQLCQTWRCHQSSLDRERDNSSTTLMKNSLTFLRYHLSKVLASISSKMDVAKFIRTTLRHISKHELNANNLSNSPHDQQSEMFCKICDEKIIPFLKWFFMPCLSHDIELREIVVHFVIHSPPASFSTQSNFFIGKTDDRKLHFIDTAVPRCTSNLLALACEESNEDTKKSDNCSNVLLSESIVEKEEFLSHLLETAALWSEDIFISRTDSLQQQYVTEFLLYPLEKHILTLEHFQANGVGSKLAEMLVQGVSSRLEVSRSDSIRKDGMRIAEAMASVLGETLQFEELHPPGEFIHDSFDSIKEEKLIPQKKNLSKRQKKKSMRKKRIVSVKVDPDADYLTDDGHTSEGMNSSSEFDSDTSYDSESISGESSWGEDSLQSYQMDDNEDDLRRVPPPRTVRACLSYLVTPENDSLAYDRHRVALQELPALISSHPLDLIDVLPIMIRVLLHFEDKFNMDGFIEHRWNSLVAFGVQAPLDTCACLIDEMKGNISLGTRMEALSMFGFIAEELSGSIDSKGLLLETKDVQDYEVSLMSTRLKNSLTYDEQKSHRLIQSNKTRRWRHPRSAKTTIINRFGPISAQMIHMLFSFLSHTKNNDSIWSGSLGERLLSEFLRILSIMVHCARSYPTTPAIALDLFRLAFSFHDAKNSVVKHSVFVAMAVTISIMPLESIVGIGCIDGNCSGPYRLISFLKDSISSDLSDDSRKLASLIMDTVVEANHIAT